MKVKVEFVVSLPVFFKKEGRYFIACCPILDVWTQGESMPRAKQNIAEALQMFLIDCFERGTLERVLKESGFVPLKKDEGKSIKSIRGAEQISIPLPFIIDQQSDSCRA